MQVKTADGHSSDVRALETLLDRADVPPATRKRIEAEIRQMRAGEQGERDAAYEIELWFGKSRNWATIHDLRFEVDGLAAQIDHLVINRLAEIWVCESKHFSEGVSVNEHGEWTRSWHGRPVGMGSPIEQNRRHVELLSRAFDSGLIRRPRRLGLVPVKPAIRSLVLVSNGARISRPKRKVDGLDEVIKAEQLKTRLFGEFDRGADWKLAGIIGKEGLEAFARDIAAIHRPITVDWAARFGLGAAPNSSAPSKGSTRTGAPVSPIAGLSTRPWLVKYDGPCSVCGTVLIKGSPADWDKSARRMRCLDCAEAG
jgi:hypothetical protein